jgi:hypothetical protein
LEVVKAIGYCKADEADCSDENTHAKEKVAERV